MSPISKTPVVAKKNLSFLFIKMVCSSENLFSLSLFTIKVTSLVDAIILEISEITSLMLSIESLDQLNGSEINSESNPSQVADQILSSIFTSEAFFHISPPSSVTHAIGVS